MYTNTELARKFISRGYCRTGWKHGSISRIDRPDWLSVIAKAMHCSIADFYILGTNKIPGNWYDHYRRCYSKDRLTVPHEIVLLIPSSCHNDTGYIEVVVGDGAALLGHTPGTSGPGF